MSQIAIVVPSYNRPNRLRDCLKALALQEGGPYPTIVVDDGSEMPLARVCDEFGDWVRCVRQRNGGPAMARNTGASVDEGEFLCFTDDDCRPRSGWAKALHKHQQGDSRRLVGGRVENALQANIFAAASQSLCDFLYDYYDASSGEAPFFTSNNIGCSKRWFEDLGGFDVTFPLAAAEDRDFGLRWRDAGGELTYAPDAVVDHAHNLGLRQFWRQHSNYGRGARHLHRVMDRRADPRPKVEAARFYFGLLTHPLRHPGRARLAQAALMGVSQVAMVSGYFRQVWSERRA